MTPKAKTRNQRQRRRAGHVKRIEFVLDADSERDHDIADFLDSLPHGAASEFIRQAVMEKIERETMPEPEASPAAQLEAMIADLADESRRASAQLEAMIRNAMQRAPASAPAPLLPETPGAIASSGIDMSRPRPKKAGPSTTPRAPVVTPAEPEPLTDEEAKRLGYLMAMSIKNAQPGRGESR